MHSNSRVRWTQTSLLLGFLLVSQNALAQAAATWVYGVGQDSNPCTRTAPCKTFTAALAQTASSGQISVLDPGEFNIVDDTDPTTAIPLLIDKSVTIDGGSLHIAALGPLNGFNLDAITIDAGPNATVVLRNLVLNGASSSNRTGIRIISAQSIILENIKVNSYWQSCLEVQAANAMNVDLTNVDLTGCGNGLSVSGSNVRVTINESSLTNNTNGMVGTGAGVVVRYADLTLDNVNEVSASAGASIGSMPFSFSQFFEIDTTQIPAISEWAMLVLSILMCAVVQLRLRHPRSKSVKDVKS